MDFKTLIERAKEIRKLYAASDEKRLGKEWPRGEYVKAFVGDVGALIKLTQAKEGFREIENIDERLSHEFGDILWAVVMLAEMYGIDLASEGYDYNYLNFKQDLKITNSQNACNKVSVFIFPEDSLSSYSTIIVSRGFSAPCSATGPRTVGRSVINVVKR